MPLSLEELQDSFVKTLESIVVQNDKRFELLEKSLEQSEKLIASLLQAYTEVAAILESLVSVVVNRNEDEKKEFFQALSLARKQMMETLQHGITLAEHNADRFIPFTPGDAKQSESDQTINDQ
jgi:hypothetical protein